MWFRAKGISRRNASQSLSASKRNDADAEALGLPYQYADNFDFPGLTLDIKWAFHDHIRAMKRKLKVRLVVLRKVGNSSWGSENCILTTTVRALMEGLFNYGLTVTVPAICLGDLDRADTKMLNREARRVGAAGYSIRREVLFTLADIRSARNHYFLKVANLLDRTLSAARTQARKMAGGAALQEKPRIRVEGGTEVAR